MKTKRGGSNRFSTDRRLASHSPDWSEDLNGLHLLNLLSKLVSKDKMGKAKAGYLRSVFTLKPGDKPHRMAF